MLRWMADFLKERLMRIVIKEKKYSWKGIKQAGAKKICILVFFNIKRS